MRAMTNEIRAEIKLRKRNRVDISDLIEDVLIKGEDLSGVIISKFAPKERDLRGINFSDSIIGSPNVITSICDKDFRTCNFTNAQLLGTVWARRCDFRGSNFQSAVLIDTQYQNSDLRGCNLCEAAMRWGIAYALGAKVDENLFQDFGKALNIKVVVEQ